MEETVVVFYQQIKIILVFYHIRAENIDYDFMMYKNNLFSPSSVVLVSERFGCCVLVSVVVGVVVAAEAVSPPSLRRRIGTTVCPPAAGVPAIPSIPDVPSDSAVPAMAAATIPHVVKCLRLALEFGWDYVIQSQKIVDDRLPH